MTMQRRVFLVGVSVGVLAPVLVEARAPCPELPNCHGCGCKGGPGDRAPNGRCVGCRQLNSVCSDPPTLRCTFENAVNAGANRNCVPGTRPLP